jgi:hypothetical protein
MSPDAAKTVQSLQRAAERNRTDPYLQGSLLRLPDYGQLVMTGDLHGHQRNFQKLQRFCRLEQTPIRHVILHELIHAETAIAGQPDMSHELLIAAAAWKTQYPDQVHFLQSNHELAQRNNHEITKAGRAVLQDFRAGVVQTYGPDADLVLQAINDFISTLPLAAVTPNRVFLAHSLPEPDRFDPALLACPLQQLDLSDAGPVHQFVWGRVRTAQQAEQLAAILQADCFIIGHEPQEQGFILLHDRVIVLASDHSHGVFLPFDLRKPYSPADLLKNIQSFVAVN